MSLNSGGSQTFTVTPDAGHHVLDVVVDGSSVGAVTSYTFTNVTTNHTIAASFAADVAAVPPARAVLALKGLAPNPAVTNLNVLFSLPNSEPARLELFDARGRRLFSSEVGSLGAGPHLVRLGDGRAVPAGMYWIRLTHGGRTLGAKAVVMK